MPGDTVQLLRLRPFVSADDEQVSAWFADAGELRFFAGPRLTWPPTSGQWELLRADPTLTPWTAVLDDDELVVGHGELVAEDPEIVRFARIGVAPAYRGQGFGRALGVALLEKARSIGYRRAVLFVHGDNATAIRSYRGLGFRPADGESGSPGNIRMELELNR